MTEPVTIILPPPPSANRLWRRYGTNIVKSPEYRDWITAAGWELASQRPAKTEGQVEIRIVVGNSRRDVDNLIKPTLDLLVRHQVIEGDGPKIVRSVAISIDESITGCRVTVTAIEHVPALVAAE